MRHPAALAPEAPARPVLWCAPRSRRGPAPAHRTGRQRTWVRTDRLVATRCVQRTAAPSGQHPTTVLAGVRGRDRNHLTPAHAALASRIVRNVAQPASLMRLARWWFRTIPKRTTVLGTPTDDSVGTAQHVLPSLLAQAGRTGNEAELLADSHGKRASPPGLKPCGVRRAASVTPSSRQTQEPLPRRQERAAGASSSSPRVNTSSGRVSHTS
jgi:hypothetical protein